MSNIIYMVTYYGRDLETDEPFVRVTTARKRKGERVAEALERTGKEIFGNNPFKVHKYHRSHTIHVEPNGDWYY